MAKPPCWKWASEFSDPFESLFLSHIIYYRVYLQVFICRKWVIFPCINADSWEKDVQLHFVSGTKSTTKIFVTLYGLITGLEGYLLFSFNSSLESGGQNIYLVTKRCRPGHLFSTSSRSRYKYPIDTELITMLFANMTIQMLRCHDIYPSSI